MGIADLLSDKACGCLPDFVVFAGRPRTSALVFSDVHVRYKPNSITLASSELAPNMFEAGSCQIPLH